MGRSSQQKAAENRAKIVETATGLFRERGVDQVSVADVMAANSMTVGGFYKHFDSKEGLVAEAFSLAFEQSLKTWNEVSMHAAGSSEKRSSALVQQYLRNKFAKRRCPILAFAPYVTNGAVSAASADAYKAGTKELLDKFLAEARDSDHRAGQAETESKALVLFAAMVGARAIAQSVGNTDWMLAIEAAITNAALS